MVIGQLPPGSARVHGITELVQLATRSVSQVRPSARVGALRPVSPLLTARPSVSVALRLLAACVVTAVAAAVVPLAGAGASSAAVPAFIAVGCTCAALVGHLLYASCRAMDD